MRELANMFRNDGDIIIMLDRPVVFYILRVNDTYSSAEIGVVVHAHQQVEFSCKIHVGWSDIRNTSGYYYIIPDRP